MLAQAPEKANDLLGLPGLALAAPVMELPTTLRISVSEVSPATCSACGGSDLKRDGAKAPLIVADTPMWGKAVKLEQARPRLRCRQCGSFAYQRNTAFHSTRNLTKRLVAYVENAILRRTIADVAREVDLSEKQINQIALELKSRLAANHRFPQPDIVAMDGIQCNDRRFQIISCGRSGRPLAIAETWGADEAWVALRNAVDVRSIRVFVTDMHLSNLSVATTLAAQSKGGILHVADRFHVVHACNKAVSRVVNDEVQALRSAGKKSTANELLALKPVIEGKRTREQKTTQIEFDFDLPPAIDQHPTVQQAHRARMQLIRVYGSQDRESARRRLEEFERLAINEGIAARFGDVLKYIRNHREQVLNYADALEPDGRGGLRGFDTTRAERKNSDIKQLWRASRGQGIDLFALKVVYHPYTLGVHIIEHSCGHFEGPLDAPEILARASHPSKRSSRCPACMQSG